MSRYSFIISVFIITVLWVGCHPSFYASETKSTYYSMDKSMGEQVGTDSTLAQIIEPYRTQLEQEMGGAIGHCAQDLEKGFAENSILGNWMSDVIRVEGQRFSKDSIDFAIINHGSMRIPVLKKGPITKGTIYELMPFDNIVWLLTLEGSVVKELFDHMAAKKGWGVSQNTTYNIVDDAASDIIINGEAFDVNKTYHVSLADYLAKGGDNCKFLKGQPKEELNLLLRDALLHFIESKQSEDKMIGENNEERVFLK